MKKFFAMLLVCLLTVPVMAETVQDQALALIQDAGIAADSVMRIDNEVVVTLTHGGTATLYTNGDFDPLDLSWQFSGAADGDVARYLDHALGLLAALEARIPADTEGMSAAETMRARSYAAMVEKGLAGLESVGEQGLRVLLGQLVLHDEDGLDGLRGRLMERVLLKIEENENSPTDQDGSGSSFCSFSSGTKKSS